MVDTLIVRCPNRCDKQVQRQHLGSHIKNDCPKAIVVCVHSANGCKFKGTKNEMREHIKTCIFEIVKPQFAQFQTNITNLNNEVKSISEKLLTTETAKRTAEQQLEVANINITTLKEHLNNQKKNY